MKVLIIGSGGREHALAWKVAQSPRLEKLFLAPGNAGTAFLGENLPLSASDTAGLVQFAVSQQIDLVIVGPEAPLAAGLADALRAEGICTFGPGKATAQIESSKAFAKAFMLRHGIPTARYAVFTGFDQAAAHLDQVDYPVVIKASGLAAGKGVVLPESRAQALDALRAMLVEGEFGSASAEVVIEERLAGPEVSLLAFTDGRIVCPMPPAQDHKRLLAGDQGPNTGGMGAFAPSPLCPPDLVNQVMRTVLQPAVDGLLEEGTPFVGVLYAGLMLTAQGPQVLEFNCRFGDPETQVLLPLLDSDLLEIATACAQGRLDKVEVKWKDQAAACVVLASEGYPGKSPLGRLVEQLPVEDLVLRENTTIFHAGTRLENGQVVTAGGRVLAAAAWGDSLSAALERAYARVETVHFVGQQYRKDIGIAWGKEQERASRTAIQDVERSSAYAASGVSIDAGSRAVALMTQSVRSTYGPEVLAGIGAFGGLFDASGLQGLQQPALVASIDGVGTKVKLAAQAGRYASIGQDIVNHCINDILVQGARPLFFLDYFATARLAPEVVAEVVSGIAQACREAGCALLGGETAEMPAVYAPGEFDVAGAIVGVVERRQMLPRPGIAAGDVLIGLRSSGPHTNGYSLIRKVFEGVPLDTVFPELGVPLGDALLAPHRSYLHLLCGLLQQEGLGIKALAHLTGGGFIENIPRVLPEGVGVEIRRGAWTVPALFRLIQQRGQIAEQEMYRVFNMGIGMILVVDADLASTVQAAIPEETYRLGHLVAGEQRVVLA